MSGVIKPRVVTITAGGWETPPLLKILVGQDVTWENSDLSPHSISPYTSVPIPPGGTYRQVFPAAGTFQFQVDGDPIKSGMIEVS